LSIKGGARGCRKGKTKFKILALLETVDPEWEITIFFFFLVSYNSKTKIEINVSIDKPAKSFKKKEFLSVTFYHECKWAYYLPKE
jgi:hypothetical protein